MNDETNFPEQPILVDCTLLKVAKRLSTMYIVSCLQEQAMIPPPK